MWIYVDDSILESFPASQHPLNRIWKSKYTCTLVDEKRIDSSKVVYSNFDRGLKLMPFPLQQSPQYVCPLPFLRRVACLWIVAPRWPFGLCPSSALRLQPMESTVDTFSLLSWSVTMDTYLRGVDADVNWRAIGLLTLNSFNIQNVFLTIALDDLAYLLTLVVSTNHLFRTYSLA